MAARRIIYHREPRPVPAWIPLGSFYSKMATPIRLDDRHIPDRDEEKHAPAAICPWWLTYKDNRRSAFKR
jgi:hypothetical protein